jgi:pimeloyl-ACP methyl ester carboxylesterase
MSEPKSYTLDVPGAVLTYDIRRNAATSEPPLLLIGSPMGAAGFTTLASYFADRTVVTYDPRGVERSKRTDDVIETTPDAHADDISRVITAVGQGPVDLFASSGGAVNALALVAKHPEQVRTLIAHEPPAAKVLPDREEALAAIRDMSDTYKKSGAGAGMVKFISLVMLKGPIPADFASRPMPDPSAFGMPSGDDGSRNDPLLGQNLISCTHYEHDFAALRQASTRIVIAAGSESEGEMANRSAYGVAERLGIPVTVFPSNHGGFLGGEYGQSGRPQEFAVALREALASQHEAAAAR